MGSYLNLRPILDELEAFVELFCEEATETVTDAETVLFSDPTPTKSKHAHSIKIDRSNMEAADTFVVYIDYKMASGGSFLREDRAIEYTGVYSDPIAIVDLDAYRWGIRISMKRTAGTNRDFKWEIARDI